MIVVLILVNLCQCSS